jgi:hypothetical protein
VQEKEEDKYRDRALERRHGTTQEYVLSEEAAKSLTVEESKYLGGDMEHTHLVKGLDFALLAKMRSEQEEKEAARGEDLIDNAREEAAQIQGTVSTRTTLGLAVRKLCLNDQNSGARPKLELFLPGRTTFVFDLDDDFGEDMPRQVSRSVEDVRNRVKDKRTAVIGKQVITPRPSSRTNRTRLVPPPVLTGHVSSLLPRSWSRSRRSCRTSARAPAQ